MSAGTPRVMPGLGHQNVPQPIAVIAAAVALTFLGLPRRDGGLTAMVDPDASWSDFGFAGAIEGSSIVRKASGGSACSAILAANNSSMSFASAVGRRFLALRIAIARARKSTAGRVSISLRSCALAAADSSALSFS